MWALVVQQPGWTHSPAVYGPFNGSKDAAEWAKDMLPEGWSVTIVKTMEPTRRFRS